jgi:hypothetical protein
MTEILTYAFWWSVLFVQGATFAWVSRARNSGSIAYASFVGVLSHALWFATQVFLVVTIFQEARDSDWMGMAWLGAFYTSSMVAGQALMLWISMRYLERGARKVGA